MYDARFDQVLSFHEPGLAAVQTGGRAWHIDVHGFPAYGRRFTRAFGFYQGYAAVETEGGWCHITPEGSDLYPQRYTWCGNFQDSLVVVRDADSLYRHLQTNGTTAYEQSFLYAGDFKDGIACARDKEDGLCIHIDREGRAIHDRRYLDLDVFHKGLARARDATGWCHVGLDGVPVYCNRFLAVEPFYNGRAFCETHDGKRVIVDETGAVEQCVWDPTGSYARIPGSVVFVVGNIGSGKSTVAGHLAYTMGGRYLSIDCFRQRLGDGTAVGELSAWTALFHELRRADSAVVEFSGSGPFASFLRHDLERTRRTYLVLWVRTPVITCLQRVVGRSWSTPYPDYGVPVPEVVRELGERLEREMAEQAIWSRPAIRTVEGDQAVDAMVAAAVRTLNDWLIETGGS